MPAKGASDVRNLWPEPNIFASDQHSGSAFVHNDKDQVEQDAFTALCAQGHPVRGPEDDVLGLDHGPLRELGAPEYPLEPSRIDLAGLRLEQAALDLDPGRPQRVGASVGHRVRV